MIGNMKFISARGTVPEFDQCPTVDCVARLNVKLTSLTKMSSLFRKFRCHLHSVG